MTASDIVDIIQISDLKKASGPDKISHKRLKISPEKIAEPLQIIFNKSLRQGKYSSSWTIAHVIAILKKGDASLPANYRPISLINFVGKNMERVIYKNVYNYLVRNKLIYGVSVWLSSETFYYPPVARTIQLYTQFTRKIRI